MRREVIVALVFVSALVAYYYTQRDGQTAVLHGGKPELSDAEIQKLEKTDDAVIENEEKEASQDCHSMRLKHPGMLHGTRMQFIHLPKTGGSSIQMDIGEWAERNPRINTYLMNVNQLFGSSFACPKRILDYTLLLGHRGWGFCRDVEKQKLFTVTAIREPVSRMVSLFDYNMLKRGTDASVKIFGGAHHRTKYTLSELVKKYNATTQVIEPGEALLRFSGSQQCRFMCGYSCLGENVKGNSSYYNDEYLLEHALINLEKTDAIAVTERLNDLIDQLKFHVPWIPQGAEHWSHQNTIPDSVKSVLDDESVAILRSWAWADTKLYEEARTLAQEKTKHARKCMSKRKKL